MKTIKDILLSMQVTPDGKVADSERVIEQVLARLVAHDTTSNHDAAQAKSNRALIAEVREALEALGGESTSKVVEYPKGIEQETLAVRFGPKKEGGLVLCGHTDVVAAGNRANWNSEPFTLERQGDKLLGRGTVDMKGSIANYIVAMAAAARSGKELQKPLSLALTWGEEIGTKGAADMVEVMEKAGLAPELVMVGEPTNGEIINGHKGAANLQFTFRGISGHSSYPEEGVSALTHATHFQHWLTEFEKDLSKRFSDVRFDPPRPSVNLNNAHSTGGDSPNAIDSLYTVGAHLRLTPEMDPERDVFPQIRAKLEEITGLMQKEARDGARIRAARTGAPEEPLPGSNQVGAELNVKSVSLPLEPPSDVKNPNLQRLRKAHRKATGSNAHEDVAPYATDAGRIAQWLLKKSPRSQVTVFGSGDIGQNGHNPNEFITLDQVRRDFALNQKLVDDFCLSKKKGVVATDVVVGAAGQAKDGRKIT